MTSDPSTPQASAARSVAAVGAAATVRHAQRMAAQVTTPQRVAFWAAVAEAAQAEG